jgi:prepilin-type N-terminal cleavage/methylation domain-containing protein
MLRRTRRSQRGFTLAEVMMATALIGVLVYATVTISSTGIKLTKSNMDKQFATQKAISMLEEMKALVQVNQGTTITVLDGYDDGTNYRARLTTRGLILTDPPEEPVSGNIELGPTYATQSFDTFTPQPATGWLYSRQISVKPLTDPINPLQIIGSTDVRLVRIRVYKNDASGPRLLAEVASVIRTLAVAFPPTQVYDVYCIAVENIPGWWVNMSSLVPFVQAAINDLQDRHPGLSYRQHWITHSAFGRDTQYRPYINATVAVPPTAPNTAAIVPFVYFYPGRFPDNYTPEGGGAAVASPAQFYYPPSSIDATMLDDSVTGVLNPPSANLNPVPYALADMYNHAMRYYQEKDLWNQRSTVMVPAVAPAIVPSLAYPNEADAPTLRLLIDDMYMNPNKYLNALVINLHGELMPFPATRNYSDPAKKPDQYTNNPVRVVTHPEMLTTANTDSVSLRVYSYVMRPNAIDGSVANEITYTGPPFAGSAVSLSRPPNVNKEFLREPITVVIRGVNWDPTAAGICVASSLTPTSNVTNCVTAITGGVDLDPAINSGLAPAPVSVRDPYVWTQPAPTTNHPLAPASQRMYYTRTYIGPPAGVLIGDTVIKLYNSPLVAPCVPTPSNCLANQSPLAVPPAQPGGGGIEHVANGNWTKRLYGLEYIPSPMENFAQAAVQQPFSRSLDFLGPSTKNTARWVLTIPAASVGNNRVLQVETYLGDFTPTSQGLALGRQASGALLPAYAEPTNMSMTFAWHGDNTFLNGNAATPPALPLTERYQMLGDPRHLPYADLKKPHADNGGVWAAANVNTTLGMGYNRYFDDFEDAFGNEMSAWMVAPRPGPYAIAAGNRAFAVIIDGTARTVNLTIGPGRTANNVAVDLNGNAAFLAVALADVFNNCVRIRSRATGPTSSVSYNGGNLGAAINTEIAGPVFGFNTLNLTVRPSWNGWEYTIAGTEFGVKNSNSIAPTAAQQIDEGWVTTNGSFEIDAPRMFQCFRQALMRTNSVYTTMTGYPYYYLGIGNEIGYDGANGWPDNVPVSRRPFEGVDGGQYFEQTITPGKGWGDTPAGPLDPGSTNVTSSRSGVKYIQESDGSWWGMNWNGELYPDDQYSIVGANNDWKELGNLPTPAPGFTVPTAANTYRRVRRDPNPLSVVANSHLVVNDVANATHTPGTTFQQGNRRSHDQGVATFYWGANGGTVNVPAASSQGVLAGGGTEIANNYNFPVDSPIDANRGFVINGNAVAPNNSLLNGTQPMYGTLNTLTDQWSLGLFYNAADNSLVPVIRPNEWASDLIAMRQGTSAAFVVQNGLSPSGVAGTDFIARWSFLVLTQGFLDAGRFNPGAGIGNAPAVQQVPRVSITSPNVNTNTTNPATLNVAWALTWQRWDGKGYTTAYPAVYTPPVVPVLSYFTSFSSDNGLTWVYLQNPLRAAVPGVRLQVADPDYAACHLTTASYNWTGIASLPAGAYIIRVEAYRDAFPLHYSTHQYQIFINR